MYATVNFQSKKAFKEAVKAGSPIGVFQPNADLFGGSTEPVKQGRFTVEGPHFPQPHKWYAIATVADGRVVKVQ